jgi:hypothetical protein
VGGGGVPIPAASQEHGAASAAAGRKPRRPPLGPAYAEDMSGIWRFMKSPNIGTVKSISPQRGE